MREPSFGQRLHEAIERRGPLCVGIDPHPYLLEQWGLSDSPRGLQEFGEKVVTAAAGRVAIVKPQIAFFERHGSAGYAALEEVLAAARQAGLLIIADVKRGDIGSTLAAYAQAWLSPGGSLESDAMTVSAYQGVGSLADAVDLAREHGKGLFVLGATSNPEGIALQSATVGAARGGGVTVAAEIVNDVIALNREDNAEHGSFGVVLGATFAVSGYGIQLDELSGIPCTPILAPGFGHQGVAFSTVTERFGAHPDVLISASRAILSVGPEGIEAAMERTAEEIARCRD